MTSPAQVTKSLPTNCLLILDLPPYILCFGAESWWQCCQFLSDVGPLYLRRLTYTIILPRNNQVIFSTLIDGETQKTVNTQIISGMFIVKCPIRAKKRTHRQTIKPPTDGTHRQTWQTWQLCCLWFSFIAPNSKISKVFLVFQVFWVTQ